MKKIKVKEGERVTNKTLRNGEKKTEEDR